MIKYSIILYNSLGKNKVKNRVDIITDLFKIDRSTFYRWFNKYNQQFINHKNFYDFEFLNVTPSIVDYIVSYVVNNFNINFKKLKKNINKIYPNNKISYKQIFVIINKNSCLSNKCIKRKKYKINIEIENFIINEIKTNNTLSAKDIIVFIKLKFNINISLTSIYNIFQKNNYTYKKVLLNINPHSFCDQKQQLENVDYHLENNIQISETFNNEYKNNINKMNILINNDIALLSDNKNLILSDEIIINLHKSLNESNELNINTNYELVSIDEFSIITNRTITKGWSLKGTECVLKLPFLKQNKRYSLLMATTKKKIIKYILVEGSIKTDNFISFICLI